MKPVNSHRQIQLALLLGCLIVWSQTGALQAATNAASAVTNTKAVLFATNVPATINTNDFKSVFDSKGRDPFFPNSSRQSVGPSENGENQPTIVLAVKGFSGFGKHRMAIINDHTFSVGDEGEVLTAGGRIRIHCVEIHDDVAVVTIGNAAEKIELRMPAR